MHWFSRTCKIEKDVLYSVRRRETDFDSSDKDSAGFFKSWKHESVNANIFSLIEYQQYHFGYCIEHESLYSSHMTFFGFESAEKMISYSDCEQNFMFFLRGCTCSAQYKFYIVSD